MKVRSLTGGEMEQALPALARLRIEVFRAFPYLYAGSEGYELDYLNTFSQAPDALIVTAENDDGEIVGCATGSALTGHHVEFAEPLVDAGIDLSTTFYFGESVLLPAYRGHGIGHAFFDVREAHALAHGYKRACFCAVDRPADHPLRPEGYSPLDPFWKARGYCRLDGAVSHFEWPETPNGPKIVHRMDYWTRSF
ncbi:MAG: GNAT family N-acetyltransferase [Hyphomonas oceanitis]